MEPDPVVKDQEPAEVEEEPAVADKAVVLERGRKGIVFVRLAA
jgi:hypothetical protein